MKLTNIVLPIFAWLMWGTALLGCSGSSASIPEDAAKALRRQPGGPIFDIEVSSRDGDSATGAIVYVSLLRSSLTYFRVPTGFRAGYAISLRAFVTDSDWMVLERGWTDTLNVRSYDETRASVPVRIEKQVDLQPGSYLVEVEVEDLQNNKKLVLRQNAMVPHPRGLSPVLGRVMLYSSVDRGRDLPIVSFHVALGDDSLRYAAPAYNLSLWQRILVEITLEKYLVDSAAALPPYLYSFWFSGMEGSRYLPTKRDTVFSWTRKMPVDRRRTEFSQQLPRLRCGMYRLSFRVTGLDSAWLAGDSTLNSVRYFTIVPKAFPRATAYEEMKEMVRYISTEAERRTLDSAKTDNERRERFEEFWLNFVDDRSAAAKLMRAYFTRVEEANNLFSTFKEGWKTDRGMLYIVMGPPGYIEPGFQTQKWYYSTPGSYRDDLFQLQRVQLMAEGLSIEEFVLTRSMQYQVLWDRMISRWREGEIF